jgi:hypothetical protein
MKDAKEATDTKRIQAYPRPEMTTSRVFTPLERQKGQGLKSGSSLNSGNSSIHSSKTMLKIAKDTHRLGSSRGSSRHPAILPIFQSRHSTLLVHPEPIRRNPLYPDETASKHPIHVAQMEECDAILNRFSTKGLPIKETTVRRALVRPEEIVHRTKPPNPEISKKVHISKTNSIIRRRLDV